MPWTDYDLLIMADVLEHLIDPWRMLAELHRRVRPGAVAAERAQRAPQERGVALLFGAGSTTPTPASWIVPICIFHPLQPAGRGRPGRLADGGHRALHQAQIPSLVVSAPLARRVSGGPVFSAGGK